MFNNEIRNVVATVRKFNKEPNYDGILGRIHNAYINGVRTFRFNLSKITKDNLVDEIIDIIRLIKSEYKDINIMIDMSYPGKPIRLKTINSSKIEVQKHDSIILRSKDTVSDHKENCIEVELYDLDKLFKNDDIIYYADGEISFKVKCILNSREIVLECLNKGLIRDNQSLKCGFYLKNKQITDKMNWMINSIEPTYIALSFVEKGLDVDKFRKEIEYKDYILISKVETQIGVDNVDDIIDYSDYIMVARGDLAFNINIEKLFNIQDIILKKTHGKGK